MMNGTVWRVAIGLTIAAVLFGLGRISTAGSGVTVAERTWYLTVHEPRGGTTTDRLSVPPVDPSSVSRGYVYHAPGFDPARPTRWDVETYVFSPAALLARVGEQIVLRTFVINGDDHENVIRRPDGRPLPVTFWVTGAGEAVERKTGITEFNTRRGRESVVTFRVTTAGTYLLQCQTHAPSMQAQIVVLPGR